ADGEPTELGDGPSDPLCQYSESDIHVNEDVSTATSSSSTTTTTETTDAPAGTVVPAGSESSSEEVTTAPSGSSETADSSDAETAEKESSDSSVISDTSSSETETVDDSTASTTSSDGEAANEADEVTASASTSATNSTGSVPDGTWPASTGTVQYTEPYTVKAGEVFDGEMQTFERSDITCTEGEGQKDSAVFLVEAGATLKNVIIGANQKEGVHCDDHDCTIENVWWDDVCEDALSIKGGSESSVTTVAGGGARYASDKVVQHNGYGTVKIDGFYAQEFGKLYRSCGTCGDIPRVVTVSNVYVVDPLVSVITVNKNYGDQATLSNIYVKTTDGSDDVKVCQWSQGSDDPTNLGDGPSGTLCQYSDSDVHINEQ
ncbi:hypothetical protein BBJ28_00026353, partial [Nothophytophthora sp. Chile5]